MFNKSTPKFSIGWNQTLVDITEKKHVDLSHLAMLILRSEKKVCIVNETMSTK